MARQLINKLRDVRIGNHISFNVIKVIKNKHNLFESPTIYVAKPAITHKKEPFSITDMNLPMQEDSQDGSIEAIKTITFNEYGTYFIIKDNQNGSGNNDTIEIEKVIVKKD